MEAIELTFDNPTMKGLLRKNGFVFEKVTAFYEDIFLGETKMNSYEVEIAYQPDKKPDFLRMKKPLLDEASPYTVKRVFERVLREKICQIF